MKNLLITATALFVLINFISLGYAAEPVKKHKVVFMVNTSEEKTQQIAINNIKNLIALYGKENVEIELVTYGPGMAMIMKQNEKTAPQLKELNSANVKFAACGNTMTQMKIKKEEIVDFAFVVKAGVAEVIEKQEQGWAYIRP
ncbi:MAG: DsrE family protein [Nitrospirae bacterium]|nr:DsrE family protein [Nitrospirota bacterium]